jgi:hypothetical protein
MTKECPACGYTKPPKPRAPRGRPTTYGLEAMALWDEVLLPFANASDVKRIRRNLSQYGVRHNRFFTGKIDHSKGHIVVTRAE